MCTHRGMIAIKKGNCISTTNKVQDNCLALKIALKKTSSLLYKKFNNNSCNLPLIVKIKINDTASEQWKQKKKKKMKKNEKQEQLKVKNNVIDCN